MDYDHIKYGEGGLSLWVHMIFMPDKHLPPHYWLVV